MMKKIIYFLLMLTAMSCKQDKEIIINSDPEFASVYLNGEYQGETPVLLKLASSNNNILISHGDTLSAFDNKLLNPVTLRTAYLPITAYLPLFVAIEKGYFKMNGINLEAVEATSPNDIVTGMVADKIDFATSLAYSILMPASLRYPGEFMLFSSSEETFQRFTSSILVKIDSDINNVEDLRGKRIGVYSGIVQRVFLEAMLIGMGIDPAEVNIIEISPRLQIQGLVSNQYDALSSTEPTTNIAIQRGLARPLVENPRVKYVLNPFPSTAAAISTRILHNEPAVAERLVRSLDMAIDYINKKPDEAKEILVIYTPIPIENRNEILQSLRLFKYCKLGNENRLNVQRFADFLFENKIIDKRIEDVNTLFGDFEAN
jgi:NitT/TauT family transport system substrate-binding protein